VQRIIDARVEHVHGDDEMPHKPINERTAEQIIDRLLLEKSVDLELTVRFDEEHLVYRLVKLSIDGSRGDAAEVTGALLRSLPIQRILRLVAERAVTFPDEYNPKHHELSAELEIARRRGPTERLLWSVAFVYRAADIRSASAALEVSERFGLGPRTASNWIRRARDAGMLDAMAPIESEL
jgi:DNA-binding transcriptional ArsR family regulator